MTAPAIDTGAAAAVGPEQTYFAALAEGTWRVQRCNACARSVFYPRLLCPNCGEQDLGWFTPSGRGTVHATTVMRRPAQAGGDLHLCLVDLDDGFRMMSRVEGVPPHAVRIGLRVQAAVAREGEQPLVLFHPVKVQA